jgi:hypothetical protein
MAPQSIVTGSSHKSAALSVSLACIVLQRGIRFEPVGGLAMTNFVNFTVATEADLNNAINAMNAGGSAAAANTAYNITITADLELSTDIAAINLLAGDSLSVTGNTLASGATRRR